MTSITPHLWYDTQAKEAALFYVTLFEHASLIDTSILADTPSGDTELVSFILEGIEFAAISAGPYFRLNPSISLFVSCKTKEEILTKWNALSEGGKILMPLQSYPFNSYFGWVEDRFGLSWQLMLDETSNPQTTIKSCLLFAEKACGKAYDAISFYVSLFEGSKIHHTSFYPSEEKVETRANLQFASFQLGQQQFIAMDHELKGDFTFNEAFSFMVNCKNQEEIDYYWNALSADPTAEQCGWLKDQFGVSWQIVYENLNDLMFEGTKEEIEQVTQAFMQMKKLDIAALEQARKGNGIHDLNTKKLPTHLIERI